MAFVLLALGFTVRVLGSGGGQEGDYVSTAIYSFWRPLITLNEKQSIKNNLTFWIAVLVDVL